MADKINAPGLRWRKRHGGQHCAYWIARSDLVRQGYTPKCVRLHYDLTEPLAAEMLAHRCRVLQAEMLEWSGRLQRSPRRFDGTVRGLVDCYQADPDSPYHDLRPATQKSYSKHLRLLCARVGDRIV